MEMINLRIPKFIYLTLVITIIGSVSAKESYREINTVIQRAQDAIIEAEVLLSQIPEDSPEYSYLSKLILEASEDWEIALSSYDEYKQAISEISTTTDSNLINAFEKVALVSSQVASVHADSVVLSLNYLKLVADKKPMALEKVKESIDQISEIKQLVIDNKNYTDQTIIDQFTDSDNDGYVNSVELSAGTLVDNPASFPTKEMLDKIESNENKEILFEGAVENIVQISETLAELNIDMVIALTETDQDDLLIVEDIISDIDNVKTLQVGAQDRFEELIIADDEMIQEELSAFLDIAADVSESIVSGEEIILLDPSLDEPSFDDIIEAGSDIVQDSPDVFIDTDGGLNVWLNIGQTETYQDVMNELVDIIQDASGNLMSGDTDATEY